MLKLIPPSFSLCLISILLSITPALYAQNSCAWQHMRSYFALHADPALNQSIQKQLQWHQSHPDAITNMHEDAKRYLPYVLNETINRKMPSEIALIPFIESNYSPFARSSKGASGIWQIMPQVASSRGLVINDIYDERRDIPKSTEAALNHLTELYHKLDNRWDYAIAAYNAGEGRVKKTIKQAKKTTNKNKHWTTFLPNQTQQYLVKIYALRAAIEHPLTHNVILPELEDIHHFTTYNTNRRYAFSHIADICNIDSDTLHKLNPAWKSGYLNKSAIHLPQKKASSCAKKINRIPDFDNKWAYHKINKKDTLEHIAKLYQTTTATIIHYNGVIDVKAMQDSHLVIQRNLKITPKVSKNEALSREVEGKSTLGPKQIIHKVISGDTLQSISAYYHTSVNKVASWNQLRYPYQLQPTQEIIIWHEKEVQDNSIAYLVQVGDTLSSISKRYHSSVNQIIQKNKLKNPDHITVNQRLVVPVK